MFYNKTIIVKFFIISLMNKGGKVWKAQGGKKMSNTCFETTLLSSLTSPDLINVYT